MSTSQLASAAAELPAQIAATVDQYRSDVGAELMALLDKPVRAKQTATVWAGSGYVARLALRWPEMLIDLIDSGDLDRAYDERDYAGKLAELTGESDPAAFMRRLRMARHREMMRIAWRDLAGISANLDETLAELSAFADAAIAAGLDWSHQQLATRFGEPRDETGAAQRLSVFGLGKLGGRELNFSSDIDLILVYPGAGATDGKRALDSEDFFRRLAQQLVKVLSEPSSEGFVFRVDLRLRPFGDAGPLVISVSACEDYYQNHGREWERYALIKARPVAGDLALGHQLLESLRPFIYRRYLDYGALSSLRTLKEMIASKVKTKGMDDNIKLGAGGIREVEFIGQAFQLIYGGRQPNLRGPRLLPVLATLAASERLPHETVRELEQAYRLLRRVENRLQMVADQQTHALPETELAQTQLAVAMGTTDWAQCAEQIRAGRQIVHGHFQSLIASEEPAPEQVDLIAGPDGQEARLIIERFLGELGFAETDPVVARVVAMASGLRLLSASGRDRMRRLLPLLLREIAQKYRSQAALVLDRLTPLLSTISRRSAYLALLLDRPGVREHLLSLCAASPWISQYLCRHPLLLDDLIDPRTLYQPLDKDALAEALRQTLLAIDPDDEEEKLDAFRHFKQRSELRVAAADITGAIPLMRVSDHLTDIAEVLLCEVLDLAWHHLLPRFGRPQARAEQAYEPQIAIVGYGKVAGFELGYGSDLDLVFLHDSRGSDQHTDGKRSIDNSTFFIRLAQRIIHSLTVTTAGGSAYEVDTRLRPSGHSGLLVSSMEAYADYQRTQAWTWEHQALVRSRFIAGPESLRRQFEGLRRDILCQPRERDQLRNEVVDMRTRMRTELATKTPGLWDIKHGRGGIGDIEFIVQYLVLAHAAEYPELVAYPDNIRQLEAAERVGLLTGKQARTLNRAYQVLRQMVHKLRLQELPDHIAETDPLCSNCEPVARLWDEIMGETASTGG